MIRLFNVYYPVRTLVLLIVEALVVGLSFLLTVWWQNQETSWILLNVEGGYFKIVCVTAIVLFLSHGLDLYDSSSIGAKWDQMFRLFTVLGVVAFTLAAVDLIYGYFLPGRVFLPGAKWGLLVLTVMLVGWRGAYAWIVKQPYFRERVYVLGTGDRALRLLNGLRQRSELGIEVVGWTGNIEGPLTRDSVATHLVGLARENGVHRVIVAMPDRRGTLPVEQLLELRLNGVKVEEATSWLEKISGRIEVEQLYASWMIFAKGFRFSTFFRIVRRGLNFSLALLGLILSLPLLPFILLAVRLDSAGPVLYP